MKAFLEAPTAPLDTACVARTLPIDFTLLLCAGDAWA
jgi:hypothetical protein